MAEESKLVHFLAVIPKIDSLVLKGVLMSVVTLVATIAGFFGVNGAQILSKGELLVAAILAMFAALSLFMVAYGRIAQPNPPLSQMALDKAVGAVNADNLKTVTVEIPAIKPLVVDSPEQPVRAKGVG